MPDLAEDEPLEPIVDEELEPDEGDDDAPSDEGADEPDEFSVEFDDEAEAPAENSTIKALRERIKELSTTQAPAAVVDPGPRPTLEDLDWDEDKFASALLEWNAKTATVNAAKEAATATAEAQRASVAEDLANYDRQKSAIKVRDFEVMEATVAVALTADQQALLVSATKDPAKLIYALGKHPSRLAALAGVTNPIKFIAAAATTERDLKVTTKTRQAPAPEETARGSASLSAGADKHLEKLEREADKTGNRTKVVAYKRAQREKAAGSGRR